jgi:hypothetical protein
MNRLRIVFGGLLGGVVFFAFLAVVSQTVLPSHYARLEAQGVLRAEPTVEWYLPVYILVILAIGVALVWLYAAVRPRLGPGPRTALKVGLVVGAIAAVPTSLAQYAWTGLGGYVAAWWGIELLVGCALACLAGAAVYREP